MIEVACAYCGLKIMRKASHVLEFNYCSCACRAKGVAAKKKSSVRIEGNIVYIPLSQNQEAIVDLEDYNTIPDLHENWFARWDSKGSTYYAGRSVNGETILMHRLIVGATKDQHTDHRDHDGLNNRRSNIVACTPQQNGQRKSKFRTRRGRPTTSKYKGVFASRTYGKWVACIWVNNKSVHLGTFDREEDAARAFDKAARAAFLEFCELNFPPS